MQKGRRAIFVLAMLLYSVATPADVRIGIGAPHVSIGINLHAYPELVVVPGYPVYYAPQLDANFFFFDGMYWVFHDDHWYVSFWYDGPWDLVQPIAVPVYILRVPVRYYRRPPPFFRGWVSDAPPRWSEHWGHDWDQHRSGWDKWDHKNIPPAAPPPLYQRKYPAELYPRQLKQQRELLQRNYQYQPRDPDVRRHYQDRGQDRGKNGNGENRGKGKDQERNR